MRNVELSMNWLLLLGCFNLKNYHNSTFLATPVASISSTLYPSQDRLMWNFLAVLGQAQAAHKVDETSGNIQLPAELAGCIVIGESVMIVVKAFTCNVEEK